jgi:hypothetical protein
MPSRDHGCLAAARARCGQRVVLGWTDRTRPVLDVAQRRRRKAAGAPGLELDPAGAVGVRAPQGDGVPGRAGDGAALLGDGEIADREGGGRSAAAGRLDHRPAVAVLQVRAVRQCRRHVSQDGLRGLARRPADGPQRRPRGCRPRCLGHFNDGEQASLGSLYRVRFLWMCPAVGAVTETTRSAAMHRAIRYRPSVPSEARRSGVVPGDQDQQPGRVRGRAFDLGEQLTRQAHRVVYQGADQRHPGLFVVPGDLRLAEVPVIMSAAHHGGGLGYAGRLANHPRTAATIWVGQYHGGRDDLLDLGDQPTRIARACQSAPDLGQQQRVKTPIQQV